MQPLNSSSASNLERAQIEARAGAPGAAGTGAAGGFADLLRDAQAGAPAAAPSVPPPAGAEHAAPTPGDAAARATARRADAAPRHPESRDAAVRCQDDRDAGAADEASDDAAPADAPAAERQRPPTLAHWLLNGAPAVPLAEAAVPPPQGPAAASDDFDAAAFTRELLQGLRGRGAAQAGADARLRPQADALAPQRAGGGAAGAPADDTAAAPFTLGLAAGGQARAAVAADALPAGLAAAGGAGGPGGITAPGATAAAPAAERSIATPLDTPGFDTAAGITIARLVRDGVHEARLQLNPAEMGPVLVRIEVAHGAARVDIGAAHAATRQAFEQTLPALAAALQADGLSLAGGQVSAWAPEPAAAGAGLGGAGADAGAGAWAGGRGAGSDHAGRQGADLPYGRPEGESAGPATSVDAAVRAGLAAWRRGGDGLDLYA